MLKALLLPDEEIQFRDWLGWIFVAAVCVTYLIGGVLLLNPT